MTSIIPNDAVCAEWKDDLRTIDRDLTAVRRMRVEAIRRLAGNARWAGVADACHELEKGLVIAHRKLLRAVTDYELQRP